MRYDDPHLTVSVDLSSKHVANENLIAEIRAALRDNDLTSGSLKLEITETVLVENVAATTKTMESARDLGVEIHIDDFGNRLFVVELPHALAVERPQSRPLVRRCDLIE